LREEAEAEGPRAALSVVLTYRDFFPRTIASHQRPDDGDVDVVAKELDPAVSEEDVQTGAVEAEGLA